MTTGNLTEKALAVAFAAVALIIPMAAAQTVVPVVVYQDNFDNDALAGNAGIGGGMVSRSLSTAPGTWSDTGDLTYNNNGGWGGSYASADTTNSFSAQHGFRLDATYSIGSLGDGRSSLGLCVDDGSSPQHFSMSNRDRYGIGVNFSAVGAYSSMTGLAFATDAGIGSVTRLSNAQTISTGAHSLVLTMGTNSNWSYSIDGAAATTGTIPGGFDLTRRFIVTAFQQDNSPVFKISSVKLTVYQPPIPPPEGTLLIVR